MTLGFLSRNLTPFSAYGYPFAVNLTATSGGGLGRQWVAVEAGIGVKGKLTAAVPRRAWCPSYFQIAKGSRAEWQWLAGWVSSSNQPATRATERGDATRGKGEGLVVQQSDNL